LTFAIVIITLALLALVVLIVAAPLRAARRSAGGGAGEGPGPRAQGPTRVELEAEREAKYQEIRDAELDFRTGKLSPEDYAAIDTELRAEAIGILNRVEQAEGRVEQAGRDQLNAEPEL
jgi:hypothetical protein